MFSYCLNDPVNYSDTSGHLPRRNDIIGTRFMTEGGYGPHSGYSTLPGTTELVGEERIDNAKMVVEAAYNTGKDVAIAMYNNLTVSAGIGQGVSLCIEVSGLGIDVSAYGNYASWQLSDGQWKFGQEIYAGATISILQEFGAAHHEFRESGGEWQTDESWFIINSNQETISIVGVNCYLLFIGFSFDIGINPVGLCQDIYVIFTD